jgi:hypothetical protein
LVGLCGVYIMTVFVGLAGCDSSSMDGGPGIDCSVGGVAFGELSCPALGYIIDPGTCCDFAGCADGETAAAICAPGPTFGYCACGCPNCNSECTNAHCYSPPDAGGRGDVEAVGDGSAGIDAGVLDAMTPRDGGVPDSRGDG